MSKKYYMVVVNKDGKVQYNSYIYNGLEFRNVYYVNNYNVTSIYLPFKLEVFYIHINNKKVALKIFPYN